MGRIERRWQLADFTEMLAGMSEPEALRTLDAVGMTPSIAAVLHAAEKTGLLMSLLDAVDAGGADSALTRIEALLEEQVSLQRLTVERLDALVSLLSTRAARQAALDQARAEEDAAIQAVREQAGKARPRRARPEAAGSAG